ncbi:MAG: diaminopimelate epimerase [Cetobacterium sp.]
MNLKKLEFMKLNPAGNSTLLYNIQNIEKTEVIRISETLKKEEYIEAEQTGFINGNHLQMLGGEFCGNASRSFGVYLAKNDKDFRERKNYIITCSGEENPLEIEITKTSENFFFSKIKMPRYKSISEMILDETRICKVEFSGIIHFIVESKGINSLKIDIVKRYCKKYKIKNYGIMFFDKEDCSMIPYVYIEGVGGCWENSCASGSAALGFYLALRNDFHSIDIKQPGGFLYISMEKNELYIDGFINIVSEGKVYIDY